MVFFFRTYTTQTKISSLEKSGQQVLINATSIEDLEISKRWSFYWSIKSPCFIYSLHI